MRSNFFWSPFRCFHKFQFFSPKMLKLNLLLNLSPLQCHSEYLSNPLCHKLNLFYLPMSRLINLLRLFMANQKLMLFRTPFKLESTFIYTPYFMREQLLILRFLNDYWRQKMSRVVEKIIYFLFKIQFFISLILIKQEQ